MPESVSNPPDTIDWLDGSTEIELSARHLRAYWDADIIDVDDKNKYDKIIERKDPFEVRFRVYLKGRLWSCICGHWCFNVGFTAIGKGEDFNLSDVLSDPSVLQIRDWKGCHGRYIDFTVYVPGGTIPAERCGTVYEVAAWFELRCCGYCEDEHSHLAVAGYEALEEYQFVWAGPGQAEFGLTPVPAGDHVMALIAWAPDATAKPVSVTLPSVTIRQGTR